jgi:CheY-like chemotaxis protein
LTTVCEHAPGTHVVQFYEGEDFMHREVLAFFAQAFRRRDPVVMISRPHTYRAVIECLQSDSDSAMADAAGRVTFIDAHEALSNLMDGDVPVPARVHQSFNGLMAAAALAPGQMLWICGEMAAELCRTGNWAAAARIEELWNEASAGHRCVTLCSYAMAGFDADISSTSFRAICSQHTHIVPAEGYSEARDDRARLETVAALQQRVRATDAARARQQTPRAAVALASPTVYVIDDDASVRRSLGRLLRSVELRVETFASAEAFLESIDRSASGCLIVDIQLAGMSGSDLQRQMTSALWSMPVIAMSGSHDQQIETDAIRLGARAFLRKPFDAQVLIDAIGQVLA